jgi:hypothetical protein
MIYIGQMIYGYCNGYFGRHSYGSKRIESFGCDWIVARDEKGEPIFAIFDSTEEMETYIKDWSVDPDPDRE